MSKSEKTFDKLSNVKKQILKFLAENAGKEVSPVQVGVKFGWRRDWASSWACRHLKQLASAGFVVKSDSKKYHLVDSVFDDVSKIRADYRASKPIEGCENVLTASTIENDEDLEYTEQDIPVDVTADEDSNFGLEVTPLVE
jgi:hypothetical protein